MGKRLDFKDIHKIGKRNSINISIFGYENKEKKSNLCIKKCCEDKHVDSLLVGEEGKRRCVPVKDFNTFMYNNTLHHGRKPLVQKKY